MPVKTFCRFFLMTLVFFASQAQAIDYTYTEFSIGDFDPALAGYDTALNDINDHGRVVGIYTPDLNPVQPLEGDWHAFVADTDGQNRVYLDPSVLLQQGNTLGGVSANSINNHGAIAGTFQEIDGADEYFRSFVFDNDGYHLIEVPNDQPEFEDGYDTIIGGIDDNGVVVGSWALDFVNGATQDTRSSGFRATPDGNGGYVYENVDLGIPSQPTRTLLESRNTQGMEIATYHTEPGEFGGIVDIYGLLLAGTTREVRDPDAFRTLLADVNEQGDIVGNGLYIEFDDPLLGPYVFVTKAFLVTAEDLLTLPSESVPYTSLNTPGENSGYEVTLEDFLSGNPETLDLDGHNAVFGINNLRQVVGFYDNDDGNYRGYIGTPVTAGVSGDFNGDGFINLADYTVWRDNLGADESTGVLNNNGNGNTVDASDYDLWKAAWTGTAALNGDQLVAVAEPGTFCMLAAGLGLVMFARCGRRPTASSRWCDCGTRATSQVRRIDV